MKSMLKTLAVLALVLGQACSDASAPTAPVVTDGSALSETVGAGGGWGDVTVMTQNLYVGADVDAVITALATPDPDDDIPALLDAIATLERTDFPARAAAIAREIGRAHPLVVGLQEVSTIGIDIPPLGVSVHLDFLQILRDALAAEGLDYAVGASQVNFTAAPAPGISLSDADVILVDLHRLRDHCIALLDVGLGRDGLGQFVHFGVAIAPEVELALSARARRGHQREQRVVSVIAAGRPPEQVEARVAR